MIVDIVFDWNVLTATLAGWASVVSLTLGIDFGPEIYREHKARAQLIETFAKLAEERTAAKPIVFNPDATMQLGVFKIQPAPTRRRHAAA